METPVEDSVSSSSLNSYDGEAFPLLIVDDEMKERKIVETQAGKGKVIGSSFNLARSAIGVGILALPYAVFNLSAFGGVFVFVVVAIINFYSLECLVEAALLSRTMSYNEIALESHGVILSHTISVMILWKQLGVITGNLIILQDLITPIFQQYIHNDSILKDPVFVILMLTTIIIFPISIPRKINSLRYSSALAIFAHIYIVVLVVVQSIIYLSSQSSAPALVQKEYDPWKVIQAIPIVVFAFTCSIQTVPIFSELSSHSLRTMRKVIFNGVSLSLICYVAIGVFGFLQYEPNVQDNIFENFSEGIWTLTARLLLSVSICLGLPLVVWPCRESLESLYFAIRNKLFFKSDNKVSLAQNIIETFGLVYFSAIISILVPSVSFIFSFLGSTSSALSNFILPAIMFLKLTSNKDLKQNKKTERFFAFFLLFFGIVIGVLGTAASLRLVAQEGCKIC